MTSQEPLHLEIDPDALVAVVFALRRAMDDLEARGIVASGVDRDVGASLATEYRADITRLAGLLDQLGLRAAGPDPERAAVVWGDGVYTVTGGRAVRLIPTVELDRLLAEAIERRRDGRLTPGVLIDLLVVVTGHSSREVTDRLVDARHAARDAADHTSLSDDRRPDDTTTGQPSREPSDPEVRLP